ncbi:uncharacterized protein LOC116003913 [Ipomoea triloba]|uniref:uncharacterized protein LOC116003913 n=1 Tax=Ipomoea triloba TaxID=35885 RepID=UPI00125D1EB4|nr:uncharacterized protein LOC116003913 [Ipomoea triloba]
MEFKSVIQSGARRSIGDGQSTNIGFDPWLAIADSPYVSTELHESIRNAPVCSLFADDGSGWDVECVKDVFNVQDANAILNIPVSLHKPPNAWVWTGESKGNYSVKSCYRLLCGEIQQHEPWNLIWKLHDPPKVKLFYWQLASSILPMLDALLTKHIPYELMCHMCG